MKKTPWFGADIKPAHEGWYEVEGLFREAPHGGIVWRYWNGKEWMWMHSEKKALVIASVCRNKMWNDKWRGLAKKP